MGGKLVISLDFELMWGVRDHSGIDRYGDAVLGARKAIPEMLRRFEAHGIRATWAIVGLLFAKNREEMLAYCPDIKPLYQDPALSPYGFIQEHVGTDENDDPYHYGRSLIEQIADTDGQEIATHTFSHYYCLEPGQTEEAFDADLQSALEIAGEMGCEIKSIVFPRNQLTPLHIAVCARKGIVNYRGNQGGIAYRSRPKNENRAYVRGLRLLDGVAPVTGLHSYETPVLAGNAMNLPASRFLRPFSPNLGLYNDLHVRHVVREMRKAARRNEIYHLWWHPHNMGLHTFENLERLDRILDEYQRLRDIYGMEAANMSDFREAGMTR